MSCRASDQSDIASGTGFIFSPQLYLFGLYFCRMFGVFQFRFRSDELI